MDKLVVLYTTQQYHGMNIEYMLHDSIDLKIVENANKSIAPKKPQKTTGYWLPGEGRGRKGIRKFWGGVGKWICSCGDNFIGVFICRTLSNCVP